MKRFAYIVALWLFLIGIYVIVTSRHLVHLFVCLSVTQSSTYLFLLAVGYRSYPAAPPIFKDIPPGSPAVDPVVHSLTLTDIVVGATVMALLLSLTVEVHKRHGTVDPCELLPLRKK
jgi:multicomponent Na+:H+ antiporter subunit C